MIVTVVIATTVAIAISILSYSYKVVSRVAATIKPVTFHAIQ